MELIASFPRVWPMASILIQKDTTGVFVSGLSPEPAKVKDVFFDEVSLVFHFNENPDFMLFSHVKSKGLKEMHEKIVTSFHE